jgi:hypothetical protein
MTIDELITALHACAAGLYPLKPASRCSQPRARSSAATTSPARFIEHGTCSGTAMAAIDWEGAVTALHAGELPCSGGERRVLLLSASLADGIPVDLRDAATGLDDRNIQRLITAIRHASGKRPGSNNRYR